MCIGKHQYARTLVCTVGDLKPGQKYRDPDGQTWLVTDLPAEAGYQDTLTVVVNVETGHTKQVANGIKLGYDREGRLYAGRYLNQQQGHDDADLVDLFADNQQ